MLLAARRHPVHGALLCGTALSKDCLLQGIGQHLQVALSALGNAVNDHALEHLSSRKNKARLSAGSYTNWVGKGISNKHLQAGVSAGVACRTPLSEGVAMKALLLIAAVASTLAGCSMMPGRSSGSMPDQGSSQSSSQSMGSMNMGADRYSWMVDDNGRRWTNGDGAFYGAQNR